MLTHSNVCPYLNPPSSTKNRITDLSVTPMIDVCPALHPTNGRAMMGFTRGAGENSIADLTEFNRERGA